VNTAVRTLTVTEKSLEPEILFGSEVECSPELEPVSGDYIVYFRNGSAEPMFRRWRNAGNGTVLLESLTREYSSYTCRKEELAANGTVMVILSARRIFRRISAMPASSPQDSSIPGEDYLTFNEAMEALKVHRTRMYAMLRSGELKAVKLGRLWRIPKSAVQHLS